MLLKKWGGKDESLGQAAGDKVLIQVKIQFKTGYLLSSLLCVDTTQVHPFCYTFLCFNYLCVSVRWPKKQINKKLLSSHNG